MTTKPDDSAAPVLRIKQTANLATVEAIGKVELPKNSLALLTPYGKEVAARVLSAKDVDTIGRAFEWADMTRAED